MNNNKLNISELKVKSFITSLDSGAEQTVKGGAKNDGSSIMPSKDVNCEVERRRDVFTETAGCDDNKNRNY